MTHPTRQEIIDAYEMLDVLLGFSEDRNPDLVPERRRIIEKALPPRPQPTMADVEWDDDKHYLAEAESDVYGKVIMFFQERGTRNIFVEVPVPEWEECTFKFIDASNLTPTGRRYTLTEVQE